MSLLIMLAIILCGFSGLLISAPSHVSAEYIPHDPIEINGDEDFALQAANESWPGDGTEGNPYVIQDYEFNTSVDSISITSTTVHFLIKNVRIVNESDIWGWGIYLNNVGNGTISECNISVRGFGIYLVYSNNISILKNEISSLDYSNIVLYKTNSITLDNNSMNGQGLYLSDDQIDSWHSFSISSSNTVNGKPIYYWKDRTGGEVPKGAGQVFLFNCSNVTVSGQDIVNSSMGIMLSLSENNTISDNDLSLDNNYGIALFNSHNNNIFSNRISSSRWAYIGIFLSESNENNIMNNTITNGYYGIYTSDSMRNTIKNNTMDGTGFNIRGKSIGSYESNIVDTSNTVNGKPFHFLKGRTSGTFSQDVGQLIVANCSNMVIENLDFSNISNAIEVAFSQDLTLRNINITSNDIGSGIHLIYSDRCQIYNNDLYNHSEGISIYYSNWINISFNTVSDCNNGIKTRYCENFDINNNHLNSNDYQIYLLQTNHTFVHENNITDSSRHGVLLGNSNDIEIRNNRFFNNHRGIVLDYSNEITIDGNNISSTENGRGMDIEDSSNIVISDNNGSDLFQGIEISRSNEILIFDNIFLNTNRSSFFSRTSFNISISNNLMSNINVRSGENFDITGNSIINGSHISLIDCTNNNISSNILNQSSGIILTRVNDSTIWQNTVLFSERDGIWIIDSSRNLILQNTISNADDGFHAFAISDCVIENNSFGYNRWEGISIENSSQNAIISNAITDNNIGILLEDTTNNNFHHNHFIMNGEHLRFRGENDNTWDDGQGEGNFWDDYPGFDNDGDGVGDTDLPHLEVDNFPLTSREGSDFDETLVFLIIYFIVLIITIIVILYIYTKRKSKGDSEGGIEGVRPREL